MRTINDAELAARLRLSVTRLARRLRQKSDVEATASQISALATIERLGPLTIGELSAAERVQPPSMTRIVAGLEELDLIQRETDERDRRVARVRVTSLGQRLLERSRSKKNAYIADRVNKRHALIATQATYAALALSLWTLVATHNVELWMVYVLAFAMGCVTVVDLPTRQAFVTEMVGPEQLPNAIGLNSAVFNA